jgi:hypothetical protein
MIKPTFNYSLGTVVVQTTALLLELPPVVQQLLELEPAVVQDLEDEALLLGALGAFTLLPAPETNSISSRDKTRMMNS